MEDGTLILRKIKVENANAIAGFTWGFPAISHFMGFTHALSRNLPKEWGLQLTGCGVICHSSSPQVHRPTNWGDYLFALTRNPLTKEGKTPSFVEEGRMHMTISLIISIDGYLDELQDFGGQEYAENTIKQLAMNQRLAGGTIHSIDAVILHDRYDVAEDEEKYQRKHLRKMLPGFALVQRNNLLAEHIRQCAAEEPPRQPVDAWLDFSALKFGAARVERATGIDIEWLPLSKPGPGWLVPICCGYRAISELFPAGTVQRSRDESTPFRFVEAAYSVGEWISPHRVNNWEHLLWKYEADLQAGWYLCLNQNPDVKDA